MKANTVKEFIILDYIKKNFNMDRMEVEILIGLDEIKVTDFHGSSMTFGYDLYKGVIEVEE